MKKQYLQQFFAILLLNVSLSSLSQPFPTGGYQGGMHGNRLPIHSIEILDGWSGISSYINPQYPDIVGLTSGISGELVIIYNQKGTYWPIIPMNTLGNWNSHSGYIVNVSDDCTMEVKGYEESDKEVDLPEGWTLIPVLSKDGVLATDLFAGLAGLEIVKGIGLNNACYWPRFNINQLGYLQPGIGYYVRMNVDGNIDYSGADSHSGFCGIAPTYPESSPWNEVKSSPVSHMVAFIGPAIKHFEHGDFIGIFTGQGNCAGMIEVDDDKAPLAVQSFGDDPLTGIADGFVSGEWISYQLYRPSNKTYYNMIPQYDISYDPGFFAEHGLSVITDLKMEAVGISESCIENIRIYPNPSTGIFNIEGINSEAEINVVNIFGGKVFNAKADSPKYLDLSNQPSGVYFIRIFTKDGVHFEKLVIN